MKSLSKVVADRVSPEAHTAQVPNNNSPTQFVNPDRLHEAVQDLMRGRTAMIEACDFADAASAAAGTPLRTHSFRAHIDFVATEIRVIESKITEAAAGERVERRSSIAAVGNILTQRTRDGSDRRVRTRSSNNALDTLHRLRLSPSDLEGSAKLRPEPKVRGDTKSAAKRQPTVEAVGSGPAGPNLTTKVRTLLIDGGWGTDRLTVRELRTLAELFRTKDISHVRICIAALSDRELQLIANDMDSDGLGNYDGLSSTEKEAFIENLAVKLDATQFARICVAFNDPEQIAKVLSRKTAVPPSITMGFLWFLEKLPPSQERENGAALILSTLKPAVLQEFALQHLVTLNVGTLSDTSVSPGFEELYRSALRAGSGRPGSVPPGRGSLALQLEIAKNAFGVADPLVRTTILSILQTATVQLSSLNMFSKSERSNLISLTSAFTTESLRDLIKLLPNRRQSLVDWMGFLLRKNEQNTCLEMFKLLEPLDTEEGARQRGFLFGILCRASQNVERSNDEGRKFISDLLGALTNSFKNPAIVTALSGLKAVVEHELTLRDLNKEPIQSLLYGQILGLLKTKPSVEDAFNSGYAAATTAVESFRA